MKWFLILAFVFSLTPEQRDDEITWSADHRLSWENFRTRTGPEELYKAFTFTGLRYTIDSPDQKQIVIHVESYFVPSKSWVHKEHKVGLLLEHERGHFDQAEIYARRLKEALIPYETSVDSFIENRFIQKVETTFDRVYEELREAQKKYDQETNHSLNRTAQEEWNAFFRNELSLTD